MSDSHADIMLQLNQLLSEGRNPDTLDIDTGSSLDIVTAINQEDHKVAPAVADQLPQLAQAVELTTAQLQQGGRLIYIGAGTSGRLGILDAVECRPTFSVPDDLVVGVIAGGKTAIEHAVEGAEDNEAQGVADLKALNLGKTDVLVGLSASGRTPYVAAALDYANEQGCVTIAVACSPNSRILCQARVAICPQVGPEALTGSTRMKSGTAQKMVLNILSTAVMIKLGKTYSNLMVDVHASNNKLRARAVRIVMQATDCDEPTAQQSLKTAHGNTKVAILMLLARCDFAQAEQLLAQHQGVLRSSLS
ncbi:N-acetylmuramic acid 6-phosphate etherase [Alteromonas lipotrueiana]|uniref:N-acetylmuramic acid 6-phosphate etherase n=1 Tax=Alteromonas lipotrueiana TaxID=2803815 RepID=UPI001C43FB09|nr:N-acetylmuramic acid 6-phosphate etherase [Alteromonas lipotrueiana]